MRHPSGGINAYFNARTVLSTYGWWGTTPCT
jgi:hypothetical protein